MLITLIVILLTSNAIFFKGDVSKYYSRVAILGLISVFYKNWNPLHLSCFGTDVFTYSSLLDVEDVIPLILLLDFYLRIVYGSFLSELYTTSCNIIYMYIYVENEIFNLVNLFILLLKLYVKEQ